MGHRPDIGQTSPGPLLAMADGLNVHDPEDQAKESAHDQGACQDHVDLGDTMGATQRTRVFVQMPQAILI